MNKHWLRLVLKQVDRNTTKESWKELSRWLRIARNKIEGEINQEQLTK